MGEWIERDPGYLSFDVYNCTYCGKLIPRHIWMERVPGDGNANTEEDEQKPFCTPTCYADYMRRRHGVAVE